MNNNYQNNFGFFLTSYKNDLFRSKMLIKSFEMFNQENIPLFVVLNDQDIPLFKAEIQNKNVQFINENEFCKRNPNFDGWRHQQILKLEFFKTKLCENYLTLDSDCIFIKNFYVSDFIAYDRIPYTIIWEDKLTELFAVRHETDSWKDEHNRLFIDTFFKDTVRKIREVIPNKCHKLYHYGVQPIFNAKVLESSNQNYLKENNLTIEKCIEYCSADFTWYGEYLLYTKIIDIVPSECLFLCFHSKKQYSEYIEKYTIDDMKKLFLLLSSPILRS